jgi:hypothetical protein
MFILKLKGVFMTDDDKRKIRRVINDMIQIALVRKLTNGFDTEFAIDELDDIIELLIGIKGSTIT